MRVDGEIIGIGGTTRLPDGAMVAFVEASEENCKRYPIALNRAARRVIAEAREMGIIRMVAKVDSSREASARWLERLGFEFHCTVEDERVYQWRP